jgi:hypothetical protein
VPAPPQPIPRPPAPAPAPFRQGRIGSVGSARGGPQRGGPSGGEGGGDGQEVREAADFYFRAARDDERR